MIWEPVPEEFKHGIITNYTIRYKEEIRNKESEMEVKAPALKTTVTGLNQYTEYSFQVLAATAKGYSPASEPYYATTPGW